MATPGKSPVSSAIRDFHGILTRAPEMQPVLRLIERAARADCTVLVQGETGTGKELVARAIHALSPRANGPFLARNCATLSPTLLESELFGHVRGAFTGAVQDKKGVFALAHRGTLLLDEVAEASPEIQGRLLRVLQEKTFVPVGATKSQTVDVRLIAATNKPMVAEVAAGNLNINITLRKHDDLKDLAEAMNAVIAELRGFVKNLRDDHESLTKCIKILEQKLDEKTIDDESGRELIRKMQENRSNIAKALEKYSNSNT